MNIGSGSRFAIGWTILFGVSCARLSHIRKVFLFCGTIFTFVHCDVEEKGCCICTCCSHNGFVKLYKRYV